MNWAGNIRKEVLEHEIPRGFYQALVVRNHKPASANAEACTVCLVEFFVPGIIKSNYKNIIRKDDLSVVMYKN